MQNELTEIQALQLQVQRLERDNRALRQARTQAHIVANVRARGYDVESATIQLAKLREELDELRASATRAQLTQELADVQVCLCTYAHALGIDNLFDLALAKSSADVVRGVTK